MTKMLVGRSSKPGTRNTNAEKKEGKRRSFCDRKDLSFSKGRRWFWLHVVVVHSAVGTAKEESPEAKRGGGRRMWKRWRRRRRKRGDGRTDGRQSQRGERKDDDREFGGFSAAASKEEAKRRRRRREERKTGGRLRTREGKVGNMHEEILLCCTDMERQKKKGPKVASYFAKRKVTKSFY